MPKVTTTISYEEEEFGAAEVASFSREVADLDVEDWLFYLLKITEIAGYDVKDIQMITNQGRFWTTEE